MLGKLVSWLQATRAELHTVAVEEDFDVKVGDARLRGRVDRLEVDEAGRPVVVDFKTGSSKPAEADLVTHPQLGAYQLAVQRGGFVAVTPGTDPGGARLVQLGLSTRQPADQRQPPLGEYDDPTWIGEQIAYVATAMRGSTFRAVANKFCARCDVKTACPLWDEGRSVTR
jgi:RecB family exonuclease